jgi:hypothetical protein
VKLDYEPKGVEFFYIYKPLAHPEYENYVRPFTIQERLMHVMEAKRRLGSSITWLADSMDNDYFNAMGQTPNSEIVVNPDGIVVARRAWSKPEGLRKNMERIFGPVDNPTTVADLNLPRQPPIPTVAKGIVERVQRPDGMMPMLAEPVLETSRTPFYTKLRVEGTTELYQTGKGTMYLGFHLDPLYRVHWNNEAPPMQYEITADEGVTISPATATGAHPEEKADADPREFLLEVDGATPGQAFDLTVRYYACDDALTFCIPVKQDYSVTIARDMSHAWSLPTNPDGSIDRSNAPGPRGRGGNRPDRPDQQPPIANPN